MKKLNVVLLVLLGVISIHAQGPTGAGTHTPIVHSNADGKISPAENVKEAKKAKKHSNRPGKKSDQKKNA